LRADHPQNGVKIACFFTLLLRELTQGLGVSQREAGRRCGRDGSWVNRRLKLLSALPEAAVAAIREGRCRAGRRRG
jgi:hypothetical protein